MKTSLLTLCFTVLTSSLLLANPHHDIVEQMEQEKRNFEKNDPRGAQLNYWEAFSPELQKKLDTLTDENILTLIASVEGQQEMQDFLRYILLQNLNEKEAIIKGVGLLERVQLVGIYPKTLAHFFYEKGIGIADLKRMQANVTNSHQKAANLGHIIQLYQQGWKENGKEIIPQHPETDIRPSKGTVPVGWKSYEIKNTAFPVKISLPAGYVEEAQAGISLGLPKVGEGAIREELLHCLRLYNGEQSLELTLFNWGYVPESIKKIGVSEVRDELLLNLGRVGTLMSVQKTPRYDRYIMETESGVLVVYMSKEPEFNSPHAQQALYFKWKKGTGIKEHEGVINGIIEHFVPQYDLWEK